MALLVLGNFICRETELHTLEKYYGGTQDFETVSRRCGHVNQCLLCIIIILNGKCILNNGTSRVRKDKSVLRK